MKQVFQWMAALAGYELREKAELAPARREPPAGLISHTYATAGWSSDKIADYRAKVGRYSERVGWFHSFNFGNGIVADGAASLVSLSKRVTSLEFDGLAGHSFLDIASWDGFYAFEAERRGASRVLATDFFCWRGDGWGKKDGFILAREILDSKVEDKDIEVQDLSPETVGIWDVVLFSGIFYHMRDPIRAMAAAASVAKERLIVETHIYNDPLPVPLMQYVPRMANNESSNYWRPNTAMILQLLKEMGFPRVEHRIEIDPPGGPDSTHGFFNAYRK